MSQRWKPEIIIPRPGLLCFVISPARSHLMGQLKKKLVSAFGPADYESPVIKKETVPGGQNLIFSDLQRSGNAFPESEGQDFVMLGMKRPIHREEITDIKKQVLRILSGFQEGGKLLIDIDVLCLTEFSVVRPVLREEKHTVYLYSGIHAENLYYYEKFTYVPWPHTPFPYRMRHIITGLNDLRLIYMLDKK